MADTAAETHDSLPATENKFDNAIQGLREGIEGFKPGSPENTAGLDYLDWVAENDRLTHLADRRLEIEAKSEKIPEALQMEWDLSVARTTLAENRIHQQATGPSAREYTTAFGQNRDRFNAIVAAASESGFDDPRAAAITHTREILWGATRLRKLPLASVK